MKQIIINADDFGLNEHNSKAIAEAFEKGWITDTTMMANEPYFEKAVTLAKEKGFINRIGIHLNLTDGDPLTEDIKQCRSFVANGRYHHKNNRIKPLSQFEKDAVYKELTAQVEKIQSAGITITHADSHHHIHTAVFVAPIAARVCKEHGINKIRLHRNIGSILGFKRFVKTKYNKWLREQGFRTTEFFGSLRDIEGAELPDRCEIMVHPDYDKNGVLIDRHGEEDGFPIGKKLPDLKAERNVVLKGYSDL